MTFTVSLASRHRLEMGVVGVAAVLHAPAVGARLLRCEAGRRVGAVAVHGLDWRGEGGLVAAGGVARAEELEDDGARGALAAEKLGGVVRGASEWNGGRGAAGERQGTGSGDGDTLRFRERGVGPGQDGLGGHVAVLF